MSQQDQLAACMISTWYPQFSSVAFKTVILPVSQQFVDYLVADGVQLYSDSEAVGV